MRYLFYMLVLSLLSPAVAQAEPDEQLHNKCIYPTVRVHHEGSKSMGSGVIVRSEKIGSKYRNVVVTCAHILDTAPQMVDVAKWEDWSTFTGWTSYPAFMYHKDDAMDLGVLLFESDTKMPTADFDFSQKLYLGTEVFHIGCGLGDDPRLDYGKITGMNHKVGGRPHKAFRTSMHTVFGDSGGPVFYKYKLVGFSEAIRVTGLRGSPIALPSPIYNISFMIPVGRLKTFNEEQKNTLDFIYNTRQRMPGLPFAMLEYRWYSIENLPK